MQLAKAGVDLYTCIRVNRNIKVRWSRIMKMTDDEKYMRAAIREAKKAYALGEVPIGCVIVF